MNVLQKICRCAALTAVVGAALLLTGRMAGAATNYSGSDSTGNSLGLYARYAGAPVEDFTAFHLDNWEAVGRNQLVLWTGFDKAYLLQVWDTCPDLNFAHLIGVTKTGYTISRLDVIRVDGSRCPIAKIQPIDMKKMKEDRAAGKLFGSAPQTAH
jgi:hypothetical protein